MRRIIRDNFGPLFCAAWILFMALGCAWGSYSGEWAQIEADYQALIESERPVGEFWIHSSPRAMPPLEVWRRQR